MDTALHEHNKCIKNIIFMIKMKGISVSVVDEENNSADKGRIITLWKQDPDHLTGTT
jgi:hypothetical protein